MPRFQFSGPTIFDHLSLKVAYTPLIGLY